MADVNAIPGGELMLYIWDKTAETPAWLPVGCLQSNSFQTGLSLNEVEQIVTKCGIVPPKQSSSALTFQFSGNGIAVDTLSAGSEDDNKASHDALLAAQREERASNLPDDWKLVSMETPGIADIFGKGWVTELEKTGDADEGSYQNFTFTITGVPDSLSDSTTVTP